MIDRENDRKRRTTRFDLFYSQTSHAVQIFLLNGVRSIWALNLLKRIDFYDLFALLFVSSILNLLILLTHSIFGFNFWV